ncbi:MAG: hypothetical protein V4591_05240, partial [Bdellovibrionota bacterium]
PPHQQKYSLIFTSKIAVRLFDKKLIPPPIDKSRLEYISAVGSSTANLLKEEIPSQLHEKIIYPENEGLYNLLTQHKFSKQSTLFVFTALNGKSQETVQRVRQEGLELQFQIIPTYKLESHASHFLAEYFASEIPSTHNPIVFECGSGLVLKEVVLQLRQFFSCENDNNLPSFIYFTAEKQSVKNEIQALDLVDRIWGPCQL